MGVSEANALTEWNLAPLQCRRAIAMLGLIYRVAKGLAPKPLCDLFRRDTRVRHQEATRGASRRHPLQFLEYVTMGGHTDYFRRSCFGLITLWNMAPAEAVNSGTVSGFQRYLQYALRNRASKTEEFETFFSDACI